MTYLMNNHLMSSDISYPNIAIIVNRQSMRKVKPGSKYYIQIPVKTHKERFSQSTKLSILLINATFFL